MSCLWLKKQNSMKLSVKAGENTSTIILENGLALPREVEQTALWLCTFTAQEAGHVCTTSLYTNVHSNMLCNKHAWNHAQTSINGRRDKLGCTYITWYYTAMKINELKLHTEQHKWIFKKKNKRYHWGKEIRHKIICYYVIPYTWVSKAVKNPLCCLSMQIGGKIAQPNNSSYHKSQDSEYS